MAKLEKLSKENFYNLFLEMIARTEVGADFGIPVLNVTYREQLKDLSDTLFEEYFGHHNPTEAGAREFLSMYGRAMNIGYDLGRHAGVTEGTEFGRQGAVVTD